MFALPKTPQPVMVLLELGLRLFRQSFMPSLPLLFMIALVSSLPALLIPNLYSENMLLKSEAFSSLLTVFPVQLGLLLWLYAAIFQQQAAYLAQQPLNPRQALLKVMPKIVPIYVACWGYSLIVGLGFVVVVLGILFAVSMSFFLLLILLEDNGIFESLRESHILVWGHWWHAAAVLILPLFVMTLSGLTVVSLLQAGIAEGQTPSVEVLQWGQVIYNVVTSLLTPLVEATMLVLFHDLKLRKKGSSPLGIDAATEREFFA